MRRRQPATGGAVPRIHARLAKVLKDAPMMAWIAAADGSVTFVNRKWLTFTGRRLRDELGGGWRQSLHAGDRARASAEYRAAVRDERPFAIEYRMRRADHIYRSIGQYGLPVYADDGAFAGFVGTSVDVTAQSARAADLDSTVETQHKQLEADRDAQIALLKNLIAHMNDAVLAEMEDGRVAAVNAAFYRLFNISEPPAGTPPRSLRPFVLDALADAARSAGEALDPSQPRKRSASAFHTVSDAQSPNELELKDGRTLEQEYFPVRLDDGRVVHLWQFRDITVRKQEAEQSRTSRHRLRGLSAHLESAREEERRQVARVLHDEVGQLLTGIRLEIAAAVERFRESSTPSEFAVVDRLQAAVGLVDLSIATVQRIATALRPPLLDQMGLTAAIRWEAAVFERRTGIRCRVASSPRQLETRAHATILYRILLEALANVARHADAGTVWIDIRERSGRLILEVRDNGRGISDEAATNSNTLGLLGMRERALAVGGEVIVSRHPAGGTSVVVSLPLHSQPDAGPARNVADA